MPLQSASGTLSAVTMRGSDHLYHWLENERISLAFTTYQTNRLFLVGRKANGRLAVNERLFDKPMGLYARGDAGATNTLHQYRFQLPGHFAGRVQLCASLATAVYHQANAAALVTNSYTNNDKP